MDTQQTQGYSKNRTSSKGTMDDNASREEYEEMFKRMENEMKISQQKLECLNQLLQVLTDESNKEIFDSEDINIVKVQYNKRAEELQALQNDYSKRHTYYETTLVSMKNNLKLRQEALARVDTKYQVFKDNAELGEYFVKKQALLRKMYNETCTLISH